MVSVLGVLSFAGCAKKQDEKKTETSSEASTQQASAQVFAMDTYMTFTVYGDRGGEIIEQCKDEIKRLDRLLSSENEDSEIFRGLVLEEEEKYLLP